MPNPAVRTRTPFENSNTAIVFIDFSVLKMFFNLNFKLLVKLIKITGKYGVRESKKSAGTTFYQGIFNVKFIEVDTVRTNLILRYIIRVDNIILIYYPVNGSSIQAAILGGFGYIPFILAKMMSKILEFKFFYYFFFSFPIAEI